MSLQRRFKSPVCFERSLACYLAEQLPNKVNIERLAAIYSHLDLVWESTGFIRAQTYKEWRERAFPWLTVRQIKEAFQALEKLGAISIVGKPGDASAVTFHGLYVDDDRPTPVAVHRPTPSRSPSHSQTVIVLPVDGDRPTPPYTLEELRKNSEEPEETAPLPGDAALEAARLFVKLSEGLAEDGGLIIQNPRTPETIAATIRKLPPEAVEALPDALPWAAKNAYYAAAMCNHAAWTGKTTGRWVTLINQFKVEPMKGQRRQSAYTPGHLLGSPQYDEFQQVQMI